MTYLIFVLKGNMNSSSRVQIGRVPELVLLRDGFTKKTTVLLDFVQMRGGRALPKFLGTFS